MVGPGSEVVCRTGNSKRIDQRTKVCLIRGVSSDTVGRVERDRSREVTEE